MRLRIRAVAGETGTVLKIAGEVLSKGLDELEKELEQCAPPVLLDLSELRSADEAGIGYLRALRDRGIPIQGASSYLAHRLREDGDDARRAGPA